MPIDERKRRILMAIVSLYGEDGEPVGSSLLSQYFNMAVSSATLRNEMAALTRLGLLNQPHTSAGRVPTAKGYRYYIDHLLRVPREISAQDKKSIDSIFRDLDYDSEKLTANATQALAEHLEYVVVASTPRAEDLRIAHFELIQVGLYSAVIIAVTNAGGVRTRVVKMENELSDADISAASSLLNRTLRFVAAADIPPGMKIETMELFAGQCPNCRPILSAAFRLLRDGGKPNIYIAGQTFILQWPELSQNLQKLLALFNNTAAWEQLLRPQPPHTVVWFGDEMEDPIPELCIVSHPYRAGGGLNGSLAVTGPARIDFGRIIPKLTYFGELLGNRINAATA